MSRIPVYRISIPAYRVEPLMGLSGETIRTSWGIAVPKEHEERKPDFGSASARIVACLREHFMGRRIVLRLLGSMEHPGKSAAELIGIIRKTGHDRYDPARTGDRYANLDNKKIDIFALEFTVGDTQEEESVKHALESFYYYPIHARNTPVRVDIGIVYDLDQLQAVEHRYEGREDEIKRDGFIFKHPDRKPDAVLAIMEML